MANAKKGQTCGNWPADGSIPTATTMTGTISSLGIVVTGVGTSWKTGGGNETLHDGQTIYADGQIVTVDGEPVSDTVFNARVAPAPVFAGDTYGRVAREYRQVTIKNIHATNAGTVNGDALNPGESWPIVPDAVGGLVEVIRYNTSAGSALFMISGD